MRQSEKEWYKKQIARRERGVLFLQSVISDLKKTYNEDVFLNIIGSTAQKRKNMGKKKQSKKQRRDNYDDTISDQKPQIKKKFHSKDLLPVSPITDTQEKFHEEYISNPNRSFALIGSAGTGKTFLASSYALKELLEGYYEKIVIVRSAVQVRDIGYTPGDEKEKMAVYEAPYVSIWDDLFKPRNSFENMKELGLVEFHPTTFLRGQTFKDTIIIVDEAQSMSFHELSTIITRVGEGSKMIICGDLAQNDLIKTKYDTSGLNDFLDVIEKMQKHFSVINFKTKDIVRSGLVKDFIIEKEKLGL